MAIIKNKFNPDDKITRVRFKYLPVKIGHPVPKRVLSDGVADF
ncbi:hypothetical protein Q4534_23545 [Cyclobacterium sp. 1_MG-2023]|nr:hypothetical protein [Cyclobacterium sp. 1_MG-2023]MDO6440421.1 hypothetical protein [Cyclobacterium sp. 1_MG-2023]